MLYRVGLLAIVLSACARPFPPPGGERDVAAPALVATEPAALSVIEPGSNPVIFRFNERLSERGFSEALVLVSPQDSAVRVSRGRTEVRVRMDGGWRAGRVYRVVLLPGVRDLFGNERREQAELIFSTGASIDSTALAGLVLDRITGAPAQRGVVSAVQLASGARYTAHADSSGFYSLRYLPLGEYDVSAFDDQNRNRRRDLLEPVDSGYAVSIAAAADTVAQIFNVLIPDTTAPQVERAQAIDSLHVRVVLDDHYDPPVLAQVPAPQIHMLPDSSLVAVGAELLTPAAFEQRARAEADSAAMPAATVPDRPAREVIVRLDRPLRPGEYTVTFGPIANLHGLAGYGIARFEVQAIEPPPPALPPDTASARLPRR
jgi:methionine-rich copper-binding protein CopC